MFQWVLGFLLVNPAVALAGHGFMTSFANIEWLPEPGCTPDSMWYPLEVWQEEGQLFLARTPDEKIPLCLRFAREKLAELEAMSKAENAAAAEIAVDHYRAYIDCAYKLLGEVQDKEPLAEIMANALLEHQYILSVVYEELPVNTRGIVPHVIDIAKGRYQEVSQLLPRKKKGALFFKEEEVRWSLQMAMRVDEDLP